jgi:hypothetical protein
VACGGAVGGEADVEVIVAEGMIYIYIYIYIYRERERERERENNNDRKTRKNAGFSPSLDLIFPSLRP